MKNFEAVDDAVDPARRGLSAISDPIYIFSFKKLFASKNSIKCDEDCSSF